MLKLPSPSVVCAQNSPVILTIGFTRSAVDGDLDRSGHAPTRGRSCIRRSELVDELAEELPGLAAVREPAGASRRPSREWSSVHGSCRRKTPTQVGHRLLEGAVGVARLDLVGSDLVGQLVDQVAHAASR